MPFLNSLIYYIGGAFLGWGLGANDSANVFGTAVSSKMVSFRIAVICTALFVVAGAVIQGRKGIETIAYSLTEQNVPQKVESVLPQESKNSSLLAIEQKKTLEEAMIISLGAAVTVVFMTLIKLPVSTSQALVGSVIGVGIMKSDVALNGLEKVVICWIGTPIGAFFLAIIFYFLFRKIIKLLNLSIFHYDILMKSLLLFSGCYGAYALGANNVANVTAVFVKSGNLTVAQAALYGGIAIAVGVVTFSKPVMMTVGNNIVKLDAFTAFITVISLSCTVYLYALVGVPVSTTQAIIGAVLGIGFIKGMQTINFRTVRNIAIGWIATPIIGGAIGAFGYFVSNLYYLP